jgi:Na+(H+)/acetate symporter ActP
MAIKAARSSSSVALLLLAFLMSCYQQPAEKLEVESTPNREGPTEEDKRPAWQKVKDLYEKAKESGDYVPDDIVEWARQDIRKLGAWEYKIVVLDQTQARARLPRRR